MPRRAPLKLFNLHVLTISAMLLFPVAPAAHPQAPAAPPPPPATVQANRKALNAIFTDYWEDKLKHEPETASELGDKRDNDQIADYSVKAFNEKVEREQKSRCWAESAARRASPDCQGARRSREFRARCCGQFDG